MIKENNENNISVSQCFWISSLTAYLFIVFRAMSRDEFSIMHRSVDTYEFI